MKWLQCRWLPVVVFIGWAVSPAVAQQNNSAAPAGAAAAAPAETPAAPPVAPAAPPVAPAAAPVVAPAAAVVVPSDYVIGVDDVLTLIFWQETDLSGDVLVRPDGRISLKLLNDVQAGGLTPEQLRVRLTEAADKFIVDPTVTVQVKTINSRRVFITGNVAKAGPYPLTAPTTVVQLIAMAGGLLEYADAKNITVLRTDNGRQVSFRFNYDEVKRRKNLSQNIELKPGDTILVN